MFKRMAAEALGISDIGVIVGPADYGNVDADDYLFTEDGEQIFFLIKSKKDEYCFTNTAFIHLDGTSAVSKKRTLNRYPYKHYQISRVLLETAG
ncbi:MAG: PH domain-containing protein, partial [Massilia sp.]